MLMSCSFINANVDVPGRGSRPVPVIVDRKLDIVTDAAGDPIEDDLTVHSNPTLLPDRFFFSITPIITIRHPAYAIPSMYRAECGMGREGLALDLPVWINCKWERLIFDSFLSYNASKAKSEGPQTPVPIVVDGIKLVKDPQGQMKKVCQLLGLDEGKIQYTWDNSKLRDGTKAAETFLKTFNGSNGVIMDPVSDQRTEYQSGY